METKEPARSTATSRGLPSKPRWAWASLAAIGGCAALCSLPVLTAALGSGAVATAIAQFASPAAALGVGAAALIATLVLTRRRANGC